MDNKYFQFDDLREIDRNLPLNIIEIGANNGETTEKLLEIFKGSKIYAFEPDERAINKFKKKFKDNKSVELFEGVVTEELPMSEVYFYPSSTNYTDAVYEWDFSGSYLTPKKHKLIHPRITFKDRVKVKRCSLDEWYKSKKIDIVNFIWMDAQGAEFEIITGGKETLSNTAYMFFEYSIYELYEGQKSLKNILKILPGWKIVKLYQHDVLLINEELSRKKSYEKN